MAGGNIYLTPEQEQAIYAGYANGGADPTLAAAVAPAPAPADSSGSGISTGAGATASQIAEENRRRAIAAHMGVIGGEAAEAADWDWEGNPQVNPQVASVVEPVPTPATPGMGVAAQVDPWAGWKGFETLGSLNDREAFRNIRTNEEGNYVLSTPNQDGGSPYDTVIGMDYYADMAQKLDSPASYEGQLFGQFAKLAGLTPTEAKAKWDAIIASHGGITNPGLRAYAPVDAFLSEYGSRLPPEAVNWWYSPASGRDQMVEYGEKYPSSRQSTWESLAGPLSVIAPMFLGPALSWAGLGGGAGAALGAGVDAFGSAVPAGFAVAPAAGGTLAGSALGGINSLSDLWSKFSNLSGAEKGMLGNFAKMGMQAARGGDLNPLDMAFSMSPVDITGALGGMLSPALGGLGGQIGSNFLMSLGRGALGGGDMGDVLKNAAMSAGIGAAGSGVASAFDSGMPNFNFGEAAPPSGYMSEMDLGGYEGMAPQEDFSNLFSKASYVNQPGFDTATLDDLSAFTSPVQGMFSGLPETAPEAPPAPVQPPQQPSAAGRLAGAVTQQALGALRGIMGGAAEAEGGAPQRQEGQSEEEYQGQVQQWAVNYLGLDPQTMAEAGLRPGTPEYMNYIMEQADQIIADLGVDPEFLNGASVEQMQEQFRNMSQQQMQQLYRALTVRGQMDQSMSAAEGIDPFTGMREEFGGEVVGNRDIAAAQRGMARRAQALGGLRGADARDFLTGMLGSDVDLYGMREARTNRDALAAQAEEAERMQEEERRKRGRGQQRRVTKADLDQIFGVGY